MYQIFTAMKYIHRKEIGHRDIKMENIMIIDHTNETAMQDHKDRLNTFGHPFTIKITDFGLSITAKKKTSQYAGSPNYMAPQVISRVDYDPREADMWSLGVLTYRMIFGVAPFKKDK
jgi:serine/threonine protein kinase